MMRSHLLAAALGGAALAAWAGFAPAPPARAAAAHPFGSRVFVEAVKRLRPSVVHIRVTPKNQGLSFSSFFGRRRERQNPPRFDFSEPDVGSRLNVGAGFIVSADGYILTSHHMVKDATDIQVRFADREELSARLIGVDDKTDLALLKVDAKKPLPSAPLGDSDALEAGEWVFAMGSPFGLSHSVSVGVISGLGRDLGEGPYDEYIQTDASINPGNSGGPLANSRGEVIGVNAAIFSRGRITRSLGVGFAIPINQAKAVIDDLRHKGYPVRGRMGVAIGEVPAEETRRLGLVRHQGARLEEVIRGGPAGQAGLRRGDVVVKFDGKDISTWESLPRLVARTRPGSEAEVEFYREGKRRTVRVRLGAKPEKRGASRSALDSPVGMKVEVLTSGLARRFGLPKAGGLVVSAIRRRGPAERAGVRPGDALLEVNHKPVRTLAEYRKELEGSRRAGAILFLLRRKGTNIFSALRLR